MNLLYATLALTIGLIVPLQAVVNHQLKGMLDGSTILSTLVSFICGASVMAVAALLGGQRFSTLGNVSGVPWWQLTGGLMGALFVFVSTLVGPRIGLAALVALVTAGQVLSGLVMDHYGVLGIQIRELSVARVSGALLVIVGVVLVNFGDRLIPR